MLRAGTAPSLMPFPVTRCFFFFFFFFLLKFRTKTAGSASTLVHCKDTVSYFEKKMHTYITPVISTYMPAFSFQNTGGFISEG